MPEKMARQMGEKPDEDRMIACERCNLPVEMQRVVSTTRDYLIKCGDCGHIFRAFVKGSANSPSNTRYFRLVRHEDGYIDVVHSRGELHDMIKRRHVFVDDHVSLSNGRWGRIGDDPQLSPLFEAVARERPSGIQARSNIEATQAAPSSRAPSEASTQQALDRLAKRAERGATMNAESSFSESSTVQSSTLQAAPVQSATPQASNVQRDWAHGVEASWTPGVSRERRARLRRTEDLQRGHEEMQRTTVEKTTRVETIVPQRGTSPNSISAATIEDLQADLKTEASSAPVERVHGGVESVAPRPSVRPALQNTEPRRSSSQRSLQWGWLVAAAGLLLLAVVLWPRARRRWNADHPEPMAIAPEAAQPNTETSAPAKDLDALPDEGEEVFGEALAPGALAVAPTESELREARAATQAAEQPTPERGVPKRDNEKSYTEKPAKSAVAPSAADSGSYIATLQRANHLLERGKIRPAQSLYQRALQLRPQAPEPVFGLGYVAIEQGNFAHAVNQFKRSVTGGYGEAWIGLGDAYLAQGKHKAALNSFQNYLNKVPGGPSASIARSKSERLRRLGA